MCGFDVPVASLIKQLGWKLLCLMFLDWISTCTEMKCYNIILFYWTCGNTQNSIRTNLSSLGRQPQSLRLLWLLDSVNPGLGMDGGGATIIKKSTL